MRWKHTLLAGAALALAAGAVWAQSNLSSRTLTGNETMELALPGQGTSIYAPVSQMRNATGFRTFSGSGSFTTQALVTDSTLYWVGTAPTTWTVTTPASPVDGEILSLATDTTLTSKVTLTANTGQTLNTAFSGATINAASSVEFQFQLSSNKWFELR